MLSSDFLIESHPSIKPIPPVSMNTITAGKIPCPQTDMICKEPNIIACTLVPIFQSDSTGLEDECADVVVCSQSFHWMEPRSTLKEINRILNNNGIFATIEFENSSSRAYTKYPLFMIFSRCLSFE